MKRSQVQLDEATYELPRRSAFERGVSLSAFLREVIQQHFAARPARRRVEDFRFIGSGNSDQGRLAPVSERHDETLVEDFSR